MDFAELFNMVQIIFDKKPQLSESSDVMPNDNNESHFEYPVNTPERLEELDILLGQDITFNINTVSFVYIYIHLFFSNLIFLILLRFALGPVSVARMVTLQLVF